MENKVMSHVVKGLIIALIGIVISIVGYLAGIDQQGWFRWISTIVTVAGIIWGCVHYANQLDGRVTFGNIFAHGFKTTAVITIITLIYIILAFTILFPEMKDKALENARLEMEKAGNLSDEQIEQGIQMTKKLFFPFAIGGVILVTLIIGAIASLIGAAVAKKKPVSHLDQLPS